MTATSGAPASAGFASTAIGAVLVFYLACVGWHVGLQGGGALLIQTGIVLHLFGGGPAVSAPFVGLGDLLLLLRTSTAGMIVFAAVVAAGVLVAALRRRAAADARRPRLGAIAIAAVLAFAADAWFAITPLGAAIAPPLSEPSGLVATRRIDVERFATEVRDRDVGSIAEVTGVLAYHPSMGRYELRSEGADGASVTLVVRAGRASLFDERPARAGPDPRVVEHLQPLVGERVTATGTIFRGQVSAQAGDIRPAGPRIAE